MNISVDNQETLVQLLLEHSAELNDEISDIIEAFESERDLTDDEEVELKRALGKLRTLHLTGQIDIHDFDLDLIDQLLNE